MVLSFVLGKASYDHRHELVAKLTQAYQQHPYDQFFYLVPNHIKFTAEIDVLQRLKQLQHINSDTYAQSHIQVFSFSRLAWYWLKDNPIMQSANISEAGLALLVNKILLSHEKELLLYGGEVHHLGFMSQLVSQLNDLTTGCFSADDLQKLITKLPATTLTQKLHDLAIIKQDFDTYSVRNTHYLLDILNRTLQKPPFRDNLQHAHFYIEGFADFSAQELQLLTTFINYAADVTVAIPFDFDNATLTLINKGKANLPTTLFMQPMHTYQRLLKAAHQTTVNVTKATKLIVNKDMQRLEDYWIQAWSKAAQQIDTPKKDLKHLHIWSADNHYDELRYIAKQIHQAVMLNGMHYRDFIIMARDLTPYENIIPIIFKQAGIPYFDDMAKKMNNHPLVNFVNALLMCYRNHCQYNDVMRLLRSELLIPTFVTIADNDEIADKEHATLQKFRDYVDETDNFVLKYGINGNNWLQTEAWHYYDPQEKTFCPASAHVEFIHQYVNKLLKAFSDAMAAAHTNEDALTVLYDFLDTNGVRQQLIKRYQQANDCNNLQQASQEKQMWQAFCNLLDEFVELLGEQDFNIDEFISLFKAGFAKAQFSQIPATLDQVLISEMGIVQANNHKVAFIIGATEDVLPRHLSDEQLLNDFDRQQLQAVMNDNQDFENKFLPDDRNHQMINEPYLVYRALMTPQQALIFSFPQVDDTNDDKELHLSPYVKQIRDYFDLPITPISALQNNDDPQQIGSLRQSLSDLVTVAHQQLITNHHVNDLSSLWLNIYRYLLANPQLKSLTQQVISSLDYQNIPHALSQDVVTKLYANDEKEVMIGSQLQKVLPTSISRLENFYQDNYEYFLKYGLKLRERDIHQLKPTDTGTILHNALQQIVKELSTYDANKIRKIYKDVVNSEQFNVLKQDHHMKYINHALLGIVEQMAAMILAQNQQLNLRTVRTEASFNTSKYDNITGMCWPIVDKWHHNHYVRVNGRIDRIDEVTGNNHKNYLLVVDYKSGDKDLDYGLVNAGLQLQMLTYLDALQKGLKHHHDDVVAGALYLHLQNKIYSFKDVVKQKLSPAEWDALLNENLDLAQQFANNQYQGLLLNDDDLLPALVPKDSNQPAMYHLSWTAKGNLRAGKDKVIKAEDLALLLAHNEQLIINAIKQIYSGELTINPARWHDKKLTSLQYSPYRAILQFDDLLSENNYHDIINLKLAELLKQLRGEGENNDD